MNPLALLAVVLLPLGVFSQQSGVSKAKASIPGVKGVLELDVGATAWEAHVRPDGLETELRAMGRPDSLLISAFLQKVKFDASSEKCRAEWWPMTAKSSPLERTEIRQSETNGIAVVEYMIPEFRGKKIRQKVIHAYLGERDLCAEIHLSKIQFAASDQKLFEDVLGTVRLLPEGSAIAIQSENLKGQYLSEGSRLYLQHNYAAAADRYQKALDLEKQNRTLSNTLLYVLVDNLSMSYGITGRLSEAKETLEYGVTQDAEYPMFYYLLACTYGEMGKMDESLAELRLAYKYKANVVQGESLPDPLRDDSFRKFVKDEKFINAVHEMQQQ